MTRTARIERAGDEPLVMNDDIPSAKAATSRRFWGVRERAYRVSNPGNLELAEGDTVEIFLPPGRTVLSAAITFLLPLALFPVGYALAGTLFSGISGSAAEAGAAGIDEGLSFLAGFAFLLAGIPMGALIRRIAGGMTGTPRIIRVLSPAEALSCKLKAGGCGSCKACG